MQRLKPLLFLVSILVFGEGTAQQYVEQGPALGFDHTFRARLLLGGGLAFFDYDNDGDEDMYVTGGLDEDDIYINNGDGTFTESLDLGFVGLTAFYNTTGVTTGDIDNDGDRDIFVCTWERFLGSAQPIARNLLFRNDGDGTFWEIGEDAGIDDEAFAMGASFIDVNKDGFLDIYVMNHIDEAIYSYDSTGAISGFAHECYDNFLYINNGDMTFTEAADEWGVENDGCSIAAVGTDYDFDGDLDIYIANDFGYFLTPNTMLRNEYPLEEFTDVSIESGANVQAFGMGIAAGDYDHDLDLDYYTTNIGRNILTENMGDGTFIDATTEAGVENATVPTDSDLNTTGWGTAFLDVDNDSWEDLYVANGRQPTLPAFATAINDPDKLYMNNGDKTFTDVSVAAGVNDISYTHGMAYSDYDLDGDLDIVTIVLDELGGRSKLYVNETETDNHYLQLHLVGVETNRDAFGSRAWVYAGDLVLVKEIYGGGASHASQHSSVLHFGLGEHETVDSVRIEWTNGHVDVIETPEVDTRHMIVEGIVIDNVRQVSAGELGVIVAPNPFTDQLTLYLEQELAAQSLDIRLVNANGQVMQQQELPYSPQAQLKLNSDLPAGMYFLEVRTETAWTVQKLLKQ